jgi:hypothetical protein
VKSKIDQCLNGQNADAKTASRNTDDYKKVAAAISTCAALQSRIDQAAQAVQNYAKTSMNAQNCAAATAATAVDPSQIPSTDPNSAYCQAHPTDANCVASCSRTDLPQIASSRTCVCFRNPNDPSCTGMASGSSMNTGITSQGGGVASASAPATAADLNLDGIDRRLAMENLRNRVPTSTGVGEDIGGQQGNGVSFAASSLTPAGTSASARSAVDPGGNVRMEAGGSYPGMAASSEWRGQATASGGGPALPASVKKAKGLPDLRQFLPGGSLDPKKRALGGLDLHPDITESRYSNWEKMRNRYQVLQPTLLP